MKVPFGKYKGHDLNVLLSDLWYCQWVLKQEFLEEKHPEISNIIRKSLKDYEYDDSDLVIRFGKYSGYEISDIIHDEEYCKWLLEKSRLWSEFPKIHTELKNLYSKTYLEKDNVVYFYILNFKNRDYIKIGRTEDFIVKRIYNYHYGFSGYTEDNINLECSDIFETNFLDIEDRVKDYLIDYRYDNRSEKYKQEADQLPIDVMRDILQNYDNKYFFRVAQLVDFMPFKDGFDFKNKFKLKINQFQDFREYYEEFLADNNLMDSYNPEYWLEIRP